MAKSAKRRHHIERLKKKRKNYWGRDRFKFLEPLSPKQLSMAVNNPKLCGCFMCSSRKRKKRGSTNFYTVRERYKAEYEMRHIQE